jgi:hypothetical protein
MHVSGVSSSLLQSPSVQSAQPFQKFQTAFQQLGQDLQAGKLTQAKIDFAGLQRNGQTVGSQNFSTGLASAFKQLSQDLQAGNLTGAKQDYAKIQQDFKQQSTNTVSVHRRRSSGGSQDSFSSQNPVDQLFSQVGQSVQSSGAANAQTAYASLQQEFQQLGTTPTSSSSASGSATTASSGSPFSAFA